jgi:hypothetical protein
MECYYYGHDGNYWRNWQGHLTWPNWADMIDLIASAQVHKGTGDGRND